MDWTEATYWLCWAIVAIAALLLMRGILRQD
jgi:hypothetical protein